MWQKCPICDGNGIDPLTQGEEISDCNVCGGMKIINVKTGMPPNYSDIKTFWIDEAKTYLREVPKELQDYSIYHYWTDHYPKIFKTKEIDYKNYCSSKQEMDKILNKIAELKNYWSDGTIRNSKNEII